MDNAELCDTLAKMRELLTDPKHWTQGTYAKNQDGDDTYCTSPAATCWCLIGAASRVCNATPASESVSQIRVALGRGVMDLRKQKSLPSRIGGVATFNDDPQTTHQDILELLDTAIARLQ